MPPVEEAWRELEQAQDAAAAAAAVSRLARCPRTWSDWRSRVKQITHAIRMPAYNTETSLAHALDGHYARPTMRHAA